MRPTEVRQNQSEREKEEEQYNSFLYKFEQQIIDAWKPVPYTKNNVILYSILTAICIGLGLALVLTNSQHQQVEMWYGGGAAPTNQVQSVSFTLTQTLPHPIFLYYGLRSFYQNHRRYLKYFSTDQMNGMEINKDTATSDCGSEADTNQAIGASMSFDGVTPLVASDPAYPCGQRAKAYLKIKPELDSIYLTYQNGTNVATTRQGVAWPDDKRAYKNSGSLSKQAISNQDEAWLVWYRPAAQNFFFKLHSIVTQDLSPGTYKFVVNDTFDMNYGAKLFHLSKANYMGNKDYLLGIAFLVLGGGCLVVLIIFIAKCVTEMRGKSKQD